jgi:hypothetical protein
MRFLRAAHLLGIRLSRGGTFGQTHAAAADGEFVRSIVKTDRLSEGPGLEPPHQDVLDLKVLLDSVA